MSYTAFDTRTISSRLQTLATSLRFVGNAAAFASVRALGDFPAPAAYVLLASERGDLRSDGAAQRGVQATSLQRVTSQFGVVIAARNYRDDTGAAAGDALQPLLEQVRAALIGWVPDLPGARGCQFLRGDLTQYDAAIALWTEVYQVQHFLGTAA